jgi:hypothetical protein
MKINEAYKNMILEEKVESNELDSVISDVRKQINDRGYAKLDIHNIPNLKKTIEFINAEDDIKANIDRSRDFVFVKPKELVEEKSKDIYEDVIFLQDSSADEVLDILNNEGKDEALNFLIQWHYPGEHMMRDNVGSGDSDSIYKKDGYIMSWNSRIGYIGLVYDTEYNNDKKD